MGGAPWWLSIVTAAVAGGFTLLGVRLTQRHAAEQRRLDRLEDRRVEQRQALAEVLVTGREWVTNLNGLAISAAMLPVEGFTKNPGFEANTDLQRRHARALLTARLVVADLEVNEQVRAMSVEAEDLSALYGPVALDRRDAGGLANPEALNRLTARNEAYAVELDRLEAFTRQRVVDDPQEVLLQRWRRVWPLRRTAASDTRPNATGNG